MLDGENRDIVYRIPTYTNVLPLAIDTDNTVYNSKGFGNGRLSSDGSVVETAQANVTGFIAVKAGDVVRLKNCNLDGVNNTWTDRLGFYKSDFTNVNCQYPSRFEETQHDTFQMVTDANGFVTQFTVLSSSAISYIRISSTGINDNSVIAVNEPIN